MSSGNYAQAATGSNGRCQEPTCDCSGRAADAVRNRTLSPRPAGVLRLGIEQLSVLLGSTSRPAQSYRLTPARGGAIKLACQSPAPFGSGETVPDGTTVEPCWNHEPLEIASLFARFQRFHAQASRHARVGTYAQTRAYVRGVELGTLEPLNNIHVDQWVRGSRAVPERFQLEPGKPGLGSAHGNPPIRNILAGGNAGALLASIDLGADRAASTVMRSRAAQTFGDFSPAGGLDLGRIQLLGLVGGNGGFLPFLVPASGAVGRVMLEGMAERRRKPPFLDPRRLPVRLEREASPPIGRGTPPMPPFAAAPAPSMAAREAGRILIGLSRLTPIVGLSRSIRTRQRLSGGIGSGLGSRGHRRAAAAGRGERGFGCGLELRRAAEIAGSFPHVN